MSLVACKRCGAKAAVRGTVDKQNWLCVMCAPAPINDTQRLDWLFETGYRIGYDVEEDGYFIVDKYGKSITGETTYSDPRDAIDYGMRSK